MTFSASDATGILSVAFGGAAAGASNRVLRLHAARAVLERDRPPDAGPAAAGGRPRRHDHRPRRGRQPGDRRRRTVRIDGTPPTARVAVARRRTILVDVGDNVSGVARGEIQVRDTSPLAVPVAADHARERPAARADGPRAGAALRHPRRRQRQRRQPPRGARHEAADHQRAGDPARRPRPAAEGPRRPRQRPERARRPRPRAG